MIELRTIWKIYIDGVNAIRTDSDGQKIDGRALKIIFYSLWVVLPLIVMLIVICKQIHISELQNFLGSSIALFTGLFFSLLLRIGEKIRTEKANENKDIQNFYRYKESLYQISKISQLIILIGIIVFMLLILNWLLKIDYYPVIELIISSISLGLTVWYLIALFALIQRFTYTMRDEVGNIL